MASKAKSSRTVKGKGTTSGASGTIVCDKCKGIGRVKKK